MVIAQQKAEIAKLRRIIAAARQTAAKIVSMANDIMSEHQARGKWAYAKGAGDSAKEIDRQLS